MRGMNRGFFFFFFFFFLFFLFFPTLVTAAAWFSRDMGTHGNTSVE